MKEKKIVVDGIVTHALPDTMFRVKLIPTQKEITAYLCGRMRINYVKVYPGDKVKVEMSPYDLERGRIISKEK